MVGMECRQLCLSYRETGGEGEYPAAQGYGAFSDDMRDALRRSFSDDHQGCAPGWSYRSGGESKFGIVGGIAHPQVDMTR